MPKARAPRGAVCAGMAVAADDCHPRLRDSELRPDHVHNALIGRLDVIERNAELRAVGPQRLDLLGGNRDLQ